MNLKNKCIKTGLSIYGVWAIFAFLSVAKAAPWILSATLMFFFHGDFEDYGSANVHDNRSA